MIARPRRRYFTGEYKRSILDQADAARDAGAVSVLLRREGLYSSHLTTWKRQRKQGAIDALTPKKRGPKVVVSPLVKENRELQAARLWRRLQRAAVENHRRGLAFAPGKLTQKNAQILHHDFKTPRINPSPHLLVHHCPWRKIVGHEAPLVARLGEVSKTVEHVSERIIPLRCILPAQRQIRSHKRPLLIRHITRVA
jgi:hypothetical protein